MKKKVNKKANAPTALGHDPLAWIDAEQTADEVEPATKEDVMEEEVTETKIKNKNEESKDTPQQEEEVVVDPEEEKNCLTVVLESNLGIAQVEPFHQVLLSALNEATEVAIDAQALQQIDGAGVQLLYVFIHDAQENGIKVSWSSTSEALNKSASQLGLKEHMGL